MKPRRQRVARRAPRALRVPRALALAAAGVVGVLMGLALPAHWPSRFGREPLAVDRVAISGARRVPVAELVAAAAVRPGTPFRELDLDAIVARMVAHPWIASARVAALPPGRLLVAVEEREPRAVVWLGEPETPWWVDASGTPFAPADAPASWPDLRGVPTLAPGEAHPVLRQGLALLEQAARRELPGVRAVRLGGDAPEALPALVLEGPAGPVDVLLGAGEPGPGLDRLVRLLEARLPETAAASVIDVRFGEQVILRSGSVPEGDAATGTRGRAAPSGTGRTG